MQNRDIAFKGDKVVLSRDTYEELKAFCAMHGETDLPAWPAPSPEDDNPILQIRTATGSQEVD